MGVTNTESKSLLTFVNTLEFWGNIKQKKQEI